VSVGVLIVDDSPTARRSLERAIESSSGLHVAASVGSASEALRALQRVAVGVVAMDVFLGTEDGVELTAHIMETRPTPILLVTGADTRDPALTFRAMQAGALDLLPKLPDVGHRDYPHECDRLGRTLLALSRVPLVRRRSGALAPRFAARATPDVVVIGASTGGPPVLQRLLSGLRPPFPVPIAIVQHIADGFSRGLADWLTTTTGHDVKVCSSESVLTAGSVVLAPSNAHLVLSSPQRCHLVDGPPRWFHRPSIDELFDSAARTTRNRTVAVILTGMGRDGVEGLTKLSELGAHTIAQDPVTAAVQTMPASAIAAGAAEVVAVPQDLAATIESMVASGRD
jgi:two-component system chemotaxis response regulator CheB